MMLLLIVPVVVAIVDVAVVADDVVVVDVLVVVVDVADDVVDDVVVDDIVGIVDVDDIVVAVVVMFSVVCRLSSVMCIYLMLSISSTTRTKRPCYRSYWWR